MEPQNNEIYSRLTELGVVLITLLLTSFIENHTNLAIEYAKAVLSAILIVIMVPALNFLALYFVQKILLRGVLFAMRQIETAYRQCENFLMVKDEEIEACSVKNENLEELDDEDYEEYMRLPTITEESMNDDTQQSTMSNLTGMSHQEVKEFAGDGDTARNGYHEWLLAVEQTTMHQKTNRSNTNSERTLVFDPVRKGILKEEGSSECPIDSAIAEDDSYCDETESSSRDALPIEDYAVPVDTYRLQI